jgi:anti-sigma factor RsiW
MTGTPPPDTRPARMPTCEEVLTLLWAYLDGELEEGKRQEFDYHLSRCESCTAYLATYKTTIELERATARSEGVSPEELPDDLIQAVLAATRSPAG